MKKAPAGRDDQRGLVVCHTYASRTGMTKKHIHTTI